MGLVFIFREDEFSPIWVSVSHDRGVDCFRVFAHGVKYGPVTVGSRGECPGPWSRGVDGLTIDAEPRTHLCEAFLEDGNFDEFQDGYWNNDVDALKTD